MKLTLSHALLGAMVALFTITGCQKSAHSDEGTDPTKVEYVTAGISGRILDENNLPVSGASVKAGSVTATTDVNGTFKLSNVSLDKNAGLVKVEKEGYFLGSRTIMVNASQTNQVVIQLIKKTVAGTVNANSGGTVTVPNNGGTIAFTAGSFTNTANGSTYTGAVSVSAFFINPAASNFNNIMPGALRGINTSNQEMGLQSYGMMAVELTGASGEKLQLSSGKTATLTFPIAIGLQGTAPATIPLWCFNDSSGLWKEEGSATKQGANYVGTVSHFSFWNCDVPFAAVDFKVIVKDQNGNPFYPALVTLKTTGDTTSQYGSGYTDNTGLASGKVPANKTFLMTVTNQCGTVMYSGQVGPFTTTGDIGSITITNPATQVVISGTVTNCSAGAVTDGFVDVLLDNVHNRASINNGSFSISINRCSATSATAVLTAYDLTTSQNGTASNLTVTSGTANAGQLSACGTSFAQYVNYTLGGTSYSLVPPGDSVVCYKQSNYVSIYGFQFSGTKSISLSFQASGTGTVPLTYANLKATTVTYVLQSATNVNITEFGAVGGYISGNFSTTLKDTLNASNTTSATLSFRVMRYN